jgi:23S rRNA (uracil1939-C5)-methyltransferase
MENTEKLAIALTDGKLCEQPYFNGLSDGEKHIGLPHLEYSTPAGVVPVAYGGFFQSNSFLNADFQRYAAGLAAGAKSILELYAGSGFFTAALMQQASVNALELNAAAAKLGKQYGYPIRTANVSDIQQEKSRYDTIFLDPPRDGVDKKTLAAVQAIAPERIIYVSCNPMTAARDLQRLESSYKIVEMALFDMFPQTYHVETVSLLAHQKKL